MFWCNLCSICTFPFICNLKKYRTSFFTVYRWEVSQAKFRMFICIWSDTFLRKTFWESGWHAVVTFLETCFCILCLIAQPVVSLSDAGRQARMPPRTKDQCYQCWEFPHPSCGPQSLTDKPTPLAAPCSRAVHLARCTNLCWCHHIPIRSPCSGSLLELCVLWVWTSVQPHILHHHSICHAE